MKKHLTLILCLFILGKEIAAQTNMIRGQIVTGIDSTRSTPAIGISVSVRNYYTGALIDSTVTDSLGQFLLDVPDGFFILYVWQGKWSMGTVMDGKKTERIPYGGPASQKNQETSIITIQPYKPADGKQVFSITISNGGQDILKLSGGGTTFAAIDENKINILLKSPAGDPVSLYIFGKTSGDYKFPDATTKRTPANGDAMFQLMPSSVAAKKEFKSGYVIGTGGTLHLTVANGSCSGDFEATIAAMNNGAISDVKYKAVGWFNNIPLKSKTR